MVSSHGKIIRRNAYDARAVYDIPKDILETLVLRTDSPGAPASDNLEAEIDSLKLTGETSANNVAGPKACSLCSVTFATVEDQRSHIRSDWHGYNLKQKLRGAKSVTEYEFEKLVEGMD